MWLADLATCSFKCMNRPSELVPFSLPPSQRTIETKTVKDTTDFYKDYQGAITKHVKENAGAAAKSATGLETPAPPTVAPPAAPDAERAAPAAAEPTAAGGMTGGASSSVTLALLVFLVLLGVRGYLSDLAAGKREAAMQVSRHACISHSSCASRP